MPKIFDLFSSKAIYHIIRKIGSKDRRIDRCFTFTENV